MKELKKYSTAELVAELEKRQNIKSYDCGRYSKLEAQIIRKYSNDRGTEKLPDNYKLLIIT